MHVKQMAGLLLLAVATACALFAAAGCVAASVESPKTLVIVVADGLGFEHIEKLPHAVRDDKDGRFLAFDVAPYIPPGATVPESASAASALSTGCMVPSRWLSQVPSMTYPKTLGELFKNQGKPIGVVTTACPTDATVAAMFVHATERHMHTDIGHLMANAGLAVVLGGMTHTMPRHAGDCVIRNRGDTINGTACSTGALVGEYGIAERLHALGCQYMPYALDRNQSAEYPSLLEMTQRAVRDLSTAAHGHGFFLMVSADRIDHAVHTGKEAKLKGELDELNAVIGYLRTTFNTSSDTMVVLTSDHATLFNSTEHTNATVPCFIYADGAGSMKDIGGTIKQTRIRNLIFPTSRNACGSAMSGIFRMQHHEYGWVMLLFTISFVAAIYMMCICFITHIGGPTPPPRVTRFQPVLQRTPIPVSSSRFVNTYNTYTPHKRSPP